MSYILLKRLQLWNITFESLIMHCVIADFCCYALTPVCTFTPEPHLAQFALSQCLKASCILRHCTLFDRWHLPEDFPSACWLFVRIIVQLQSYGPLSLSFFLPIVCLSVGSIEHHGFMIFWLFSYFPSQSDNLKKKRLLLLTLSSTPLNL
jgi:hypothetical protein